MFEFKITMEEGLLADIREWLSLRMPDWLAYTITASLMGFLLVLCSAVWAGERVAKGFLFAGGVYLFFKYFDPTITVFSKVVG